MTETLLDDIWIRRLDPGPAGATTLVCFPHAGGSATYFAQMAALLKERLQVLAVQYPGRQDRLRDRCLTSIEELAEETYTALEPILTQPVAFFGHSMGAMIAFEVATRMQRRLDLAPAALFVSGRRAPSRRREEENIHRRDDAGFVAELKSLSGTDMRVLDDPDVLAMVLPSMRSDYTAVETYRWRPGPRLDCPIVALTGDQDPKASLDDVQAWRSHTSGQFQLHTFTGGHFYLAEHQRAVADTVLGRLSA